ncbi:MAG: DUF2812 domain-containing protein [Methanomassiliicoccaceae archaeon]|nr:DUF2812 domain-containing protein [Methanomassiliicoccaceae archaeon]
MSAKGLAFTGFFFRYYFTDSRPGEYIYRIELMEHLARHPESMKYFSFMAENGVEHVQSWGRWTYFRRKAEDGPFDIYTDTDSKLAHYRRISTLWLALMGAMMLMGASRVFTVIEYLRGMAAGDMAFETFLLTFYAIAAMLSFAGLYSVRKKIKKLKQERNLME